METTCTGAVATSENKLGRGITPYSAAASLFPSNVAVFLQFHIH
jgi:hypothetical protein